MLYFLMLSTLCNLGLLFYTYMGGGVLNDCVGSGIGFGFGILALIIYATTPTVQ